jgi:hypothetical protein
MELSVAVVHAEEVGYAQPDDRPRQHYNGHYRYENGAQSD